MTTKDDTGKHDGAALGNLAYTPGQHGFAFLLDGVDDGVAIFDGDMLWPKGSFSVEAWVKTAASGALVIKYQCGGFCPNGRSQALWRLAIDNGNASFGFRTDGDNSGGALVTDTTQTVANSTWHHLVGVRDIDAGQIVLYVDGEPAAVAALTDIQRGPLTDADGEVDPVLVGAEALAGGPGYLGFRAGAIDEIAYFNAALTADQVRAIHAAADGECP